MNGVGKSKGKVNLMVILYVWYLFQVLDIRLISIKYLYLVIDFPKSLPNFVTRWVVYAILDTLYLISIMIQWWDMKLDPST